MKTAPIPANEAQRLASLRKLHILDTGPEERFDAIVDFAASEFDVPIALVSLVDQDRQWFKAKVGLPVPQAPRDISFCGHAIQNRELFVVEDALNDERFHDNPLVTDNPHVRFYAGAPLRMKDGTVAGTLCLIASRARRFGADEQKMLRTLRDLVEDELQAPRH